MAPISKPLPRQLLLAPNANATIKLDDAWSSEPPYRSTTHPQAMTTAVALQNSIRHVNYFSVTRLAILNASPAAFPAESTMIFMGDLLVEGFSNTLPGASVIILNTPEHSVASGESGDVTAWIDDICFAKPSKERETVSLKA